MRGDWRGLAPDRWREVPLKRVASLKSGDAISADLIDGSGDYPVFGGNGIRGYTSTYNRDGSHVLIGRQGALCGNINCASGKYWASEHAVVVTATGGNDIRWLGNLLSSLNLGQYSQSAAQPGLAVDVIANLSVPVPPSEMQHAIADYLDAETCRIDAVIERRKATFALVAERVEAIIEGAVASAGRRAGRIPLRRLASGITVGVVVQPATFYADYGWPFLRGQNLSAGRITDSDLRFISEADNRAHAKSILCAEDVLVSRVGLTGQAAVVPPWAVGGNCVGMLIVRTGHRLDPRFAELVVNSRTSQQELQALAGGSVQDVLNASALGLLAVPNLTVGEQREMVRNLDGVRAAHQLIRRSLSSQEELMLERRQALITAGVTGQLAIPGVAA